MSQPIYRQQKTETSSVAAHSCGEPNPGGAHTRFRLVISNGNESLVERLHFQDGNPDEECNGVTNDLLLAVVLRRLQGFQAGPFACAENQCAIEGVAMALAAINVRTNNRIKRGVAGEQKV